MRDYVLVWTITLGIAAASTRLGRADEEFSLVIDPFTGAASLRNDGAAAVALDSYLITSAAGAILSAAGWDSLEDNNMPGWREISPTTPNRLGELNLFNSLTIGARASVAIGNLYQPFTPASFGLAEPGLTSLNFSYTLASEGAARIGDVEFSARNTIVLVVDPATGAAELQNQSGFSVNIDSYLVRSRLNSLDVADWTPLADGNAAWAAAPGAANRIAEANLFGSTPLASNGGSLSIGNPINPALLEDEADLVLEFTIDGAPAFIGGVLFASSGAPGDDADFDTDGDVDGNDLAIWRAGFGDPGGQPDGDADGDGVVSGHDFLIWQRQLGGAAASSTATAVPEPVMLLPAVASFLLLAAQRLNPRRHGGA